jgi:hypothetical protein
VICAEKRPSTLPGQNVQKSGLVRCTAHNLQTKDEQHCLTPHVAEFGCHRVDVERVAVEPCLHRHVLFPADFEGHWRRVDAASKVEMPQLIQGGVIVGRHGSISKARYQEAARRREGRAVVGIRYM